MNLRTPAILAACAALLTGCATKDFVMEKIGMSETATKKYVDGVATDLNGRIDKVDEASQTRVNALAKDLDGRLSAQQAGIDSASRTAQEALERANAAGKLAAGKFLYETTLTSQIAFGFDGNELTDEARKALDDFAARIKAENKNVYIEIQGHTDSTGPEYTNLKIGEQRAEAVRRYLAVHHGFPLHRMNVISYGESAPIASNKTREGRAQNRRVTLVVLQ
jgi:outer membrane protein OmpA-like peptidoglycan-associated protein